MATFTAGPLVNPGGNIDPDQPVRNALNLDALQAQDQKLRDQQTFRDNAAGLLARDPAATGHALGANPQAAQAFLDSIPAMDQNTRTQTASDIAASGSLAGTILNLPPDQRAAAWNAGRQTLIQGGHKNVPPPDYPGDHAMLAMRGLALTAQEQIAQQAQALTTSPQSPLQSIPGNDLPGSTPSVAAAPRGASGPGYGGALAQSESSGDPTRVNAQGYAGAYQFGTARLHDLGFYAPAQGENLAKNQWQGSITVPGFGTMTLQQFLHNRSAQDTVQAASHADIQQAIAQTPGAERFNAQGLQAVAHLGGVGGMRKFVSTNGAYNPDDANGTYLSDYYRKFSSAGGGQTQAPAVAAPPAPVSPSARVQVADATPRNRATDASPSAPISAVPTVPAGTTDADTPDQLGAKLVNLRSSLGAPGQVLPTAPVPSGRQSAAGADPSTTGTQGAPIAPQQAGGTNALNLPSDAAPPAVPASLPAAAANPPAAASAAPPSGTNALFTPTAAPSPAPARPQDAPPVSSPQSQPQGRFLYRGNAMVPVPNSPGYFYAQGTDGRMIAQKLPGAPGAGVDTHFAPDGTMTQVDKQTGQVLNIQHGAAANTARITTVDDGQTIHFIQPGSGEIGSQPKQPNTNLIQQQDYERDQKVANDASQELNSARNLELNLREQRTIAQDLTNTGAGGEQRAKLANYAETYLPKDIAAGLERALSLPGAVPAQELVKAQVTAAGRQENENVGSRGGLGLTNLYLRANPGLETQPEAIRDVQNLQGVSNLYQQDYLNGLVKHINDRSTDFRENGKPYTPSTAYNVQWNQGRGPAVYLAAAEALNQKPYAKWSAGLTQDEQKRALEIASRVNNTGSYIGPRGSATLTSFGAPQSGQQPQQQPAAPPNEAVAYLRTHPNYAPEFDAWYGAGSSTRALGPGNAAER